MGKTSMTLLSGEVLDDERELTLGELCRACALPDERIVEFVAEGIIEPRGRSREHWRFTALSLRRVRRAARLERDLGLNPAGAALVLDLLEEIEALHARLGIRERRG